MQNLKVKIDQIKETPFQLKVEHPVEQFPILFEMQNRGECVFLSDVSGILTIRRDCEYFVASGSVTVPVNLPCSRCLKPVTITLAPYFKVVYRKDTGDNEAIEDETELTEDDLVSTLYSGDLLDISHEIEMQIAMSLPVKPLCSQSCKGLCPVCGIDMSLESCRCDEEVPASPFSMLKNFKTNR